MNKRHIMQQGMTIAFLGPDGSGKSTLISGLLRRDLPFLQTDYFHLKPLVTKESKTNNVVEDPHAQGTYSSLKSYIKLFIFIVQYNYGWVKNIKPLKKKNSLIIFDRYYDDLLVDFKRYRYGGSKSVAKLVAKCIPKPDIYFILITDWEIIHNRKQEVSIDELKRQLKGYRNLVDNEQYVHVDVSKSPAKIVNQLQEVILNKLNDR